MEMASFAIALLFIFTLVSVAEASKFESFVVNVEKITETNRDCKQIGKLHYTPNKRLVKVSYT